MKKIRYILAILIIVLFFQNCRKEEKKESFKNYNLDYNIPYSGLYDFNKNTFQPIFNITYTNYLTTEDQEKIINKFFEYNMNNKEGEVSIFESVTVPSFDNMFTLYRDNKQYFYVTIGKSTNPVIKLFISRNKKEVLKFNNFMDSIIVSNVKFKEIEDSIRKIQKNGEIIIL